MPLRSAPGALWVDAKLIEMGEPGMKKQQAAFIARQRPFVAGRRPLPVAGTHPPAGSPSGALTADFVRQDGFAGC